MAERGRPARRAISAEPPKPFGHPDLVLARAVGAGVVCSDDAELIGATRLGEMTLEEAARAWGLDYKTAAQRRRRAEVALVTWILEENVSGIAVDATFRRSGDRRSIRDGRRGGRPRQGHGRAGQGI